MVTEGVYVNLNPLIHPTLPSPPGVHTLVLCVWGHGHLKSCSDQKSARQIPGTSLVICLP